MDSILGRISTRFTGVSRGVRHRVGQTPGPLDNDVSLQAGLPARHQDRLDGPPHPCRGVFRQKLQHADILTGSGLGTMPSFQLFSQLMETGRQLPLTKDAGMIQGRRATA